MTARDDERSVVRGLHLGADDYLVKPVRLAELLARIEAVARRSGLAATAEPATVGSRTWRSTWTPAGSRPPATEIELTAKEFDILAVLARQPRRGGQPPAAARRGVGRRVPGGVPLARRPPDPAAREARPPRPAGHHPRLRLPAGGRRGAASAPRVLLAFAVLAVAGFAVPLLDSTAAQPHRTVRRCPARPTSTRFAALAEQADDGGRPAALRRSRPHTELYGDAVVVVDAPAPGRWSRPGMRGRRPGGGGRVDAALRNQPRAGAATAAPVVERRPAARPPGRHRHAGGRRGGAAQSRSRPRSPTSPCAGR